MKARTAQLPAIVTFTVVLLAIAGAAGAAAAAPCSCTTVTAIVCGEDGNSYQNQCLAECQGVAVLAAPGPCTAASNVGAKMVQAFAAAAASDSSLVAAMSAYRVPPLTAAQLDQVAAAAAGVVQGFDRSAGTRVVTAADMARLEGQGMVLVGVMKAVPGFRPAPPPVPGDAADRLTGPYENFGATEAALTADGLLYKHRQLAKHAAMVAVAAAKAAADTAAALAQDGPTADQANALGLVSLTSFQPAGDEALGALDNGSDSGVDGPDESQTGSGNTSHGLEGAAGEEEPAGGLDSDDVLLHNTTGLLGTPVAAGSGTIWPAPLAGSSLGRRLARVFSPDDRVELANRQRTLVKAVGRVTYDLDGSGHFCSGAMVGRFTVLTAAHCVLSADTPGVMATAWTFAAGFNRWGPDSRYGRVAASLFYFDTRFWDKDSWWLWDIAVVVLEKGVGVKSGYFGIGFKPRGYRGPLHTAGYPGDKPLWSFWAINQDNTSCVVQDTDGLDAVMAHTCDTYPGQSGSPMWIPSTSTILGVVSWERPDTNGACAVNPFWYRFIRSRRPARPIRKHSQQPSAGGGQ